MSHGGLEPSTRTPSTRALPSPRGSGLSDASSLAVSEESPAASLLSLRSGLSPLSLLSGAGRLTRCGRSGVGAGRDDCGGGGGADGGVLTFSRLTTTCSAATPVNEIGRLTET